MWNRPSCRGACALFPNGDTSSDVAERVHGTRQKAAGSKNGLGVFQREKVAVPWVIFPRGKGMSFLVRFSPGGIFAGRIFREGKETSRLKPHVAVLPMSSRVHAHARSTQTPYCAQYPHAMGHKGTVPLPLRAARLPPPGSTSARPCPLGQPGKRLPGEERIGGADPLLIRSSPVC